MLGRMRFRLSLGTRCRHGNIVAPASAKVYPKESAKATNFEGTYAPHPAYQCLQAAGRILPPSLRRQSEETILMRQSTKRFALVVLGLCLAAAPFAGAEEWSKTYTITGKPTCAWKRPTPTSTSTPGIRTRSRRASLPIITRLRPRP